MEETFETRDNKGIDAAEIAGDLGGEALIDGLFGIAESTVGHIGDIIGEVAGSVSIDI